MFDTSYKFKSNLRYCHPPSFFVDYYYYLLILKAVTIIACVILSGLISYIIKQEILNNSITKGGIFAKIRSRQRDTQAANLREYKKPSNTTRELLSADLSWIFSFWIVEYYRSVSFCELDEIV